MNRNNLRGSKENTNLINMNFCVPWFVGCNHSELFIDMPTLQ